MVYWRESMANRRGERFMLKLPYGTSNFTKVARENYYFVDRTAYIAQLEALSKSQEVLEEKASCLFV